MSAIEKGTSRLGLIINKDETLQSADYLVYGKVPIFRGSIRGLETKRWSRVTCVTNDQLPTLANTMSSISSNALTVAHFSYSPLNAMLHYNFLGNFGRIVLDLHNPAVKSQISLKVKNPKLLDTKSYKSLVLYLDPCLGGACGMSLTRFLIRGFPDPVTESLTFWKVVYENGDPSTKKIALSAGNPRIAPLSAESFKKLLEDPSGLNVGGSANPTTLIKEEIKTTLIFNSNKIKNNIMKSALQYLHQNEGVLYDFMRSIKPLFPRFLSEYLSATYLGIVQGLVGLFQNSKTIRTVFTRSIDRKIKAVIIKSEIQTIESVASMSQRPTPELLWPCSAQKADNLRHKSWGEAVYGATVPHPMELLTYPIKQGAACIQCSGPPPSSYYISTLVPRGLVGYKDSRGPYKAYLGSKTSESTSILRQWEREAKVPLIKRAAKLRASLGWFVDQESRLGQSILQNLEALTGEEWGAKIEGAKRTGSALHRFSCSRQSSAGYSAQSPAKLTWICTTTDTLSTLNSINHDFMHQSLLIYAQATVSELMDGSPEQGFFHHHIGCDNCLREINEIKLDTPRDFTHTDVSNILVKWKPESTSWSQSKEISDIRMGNWDVLLPPEQSFHIGRACGFMYGDLKMSNDSRAEDTSLFPLSIQKKVIPRAFMEGLLEGLIRASSIHCISRRSVSELKRPKEALLGVGLHLINELSNQPGLMTLWRSDGFESLFLEIPYKVPPSYPMSDRDLGALGRSYLRHMYIQKYVDSPIFRFRYKYIWIFADINDVRIFGMMSVSTSLVPALYSNKFDKHTKDLIRTSKDKIINLRDPEYTKTNFPLEVKNMLRTNEEIRHACKSIILQTRRDLRGQLNWGRELAVPLWTIEIPYLSKSQKDQLTDLNPEIPRIQNPLISGMRLFQFATGSHYKIQSILQHMDIKFQDALCGGDGSGGIGSYLLRSNPHARLIFNSLLNLSEVDLRGTSPSPPSAILALGSHSLRCVNLKSVWENPNDLSDSSTWEYFIKLKNTFHLNLDIVILDMECGSNIVSDAIERNVNEYIFRLLENHGTLIYKTFLQRLLDPDSILLNQVGTQFRRITCAVSDLASSQTSEVYIVMNGREIHHNSGSPDLRQILRQLNKFPAMTGGENEFKRALTLKDYDYYKGVPESIVTDPVEELCVTLETFGVEVGVTAILGETIKTCHFESQKEIPYLVMFVALNSILGLTAIHQVYRPPVSDSRVYNTGVLLVGFLNWISLCCNDYLIHRNAQLMVSGHFSLSWIDRRVILKKNKESGYIRIFSLCQKYPRRKNFHLDSHMSRIGQFQRTLTRIFGYELFSPDTEQMNELLKIFSDGLSIGTFSRRIDLLQVLTNRSKLCTGSVDITWTSDETEEGGWIS